MNGAFAWGLLSALGYGATDFVARFSGRAIGVWRTMFYGQCAALLLATAWLILDWETWTAAATEAPIWAWLAAIGSALVLLGATAMLYRGLATGRLAVVAPIAAGYGGVTALLEAIVRGGFPLLQMIGLALAICGAALTALPQKKAGREAAGTSGLSWALGAAVAYGVGFWIQGTAAVPQLGPALPFWLYYAIGPLVLGVAASAVGQPLNAPRGRALILAIATGLFAACGYLALVLGYRTGSVAMVTVLSSLASAVTVLLARFIIREPVALVQWTGVAVLLVGLGFLHTA